MSDGIASKSRNRKSNYNTDDSQLTLTSYILLIRNISVFKVGRISECIITKTFVHHSLLEMLVQFITRNLSTMSLLEMQLFWQENGTSRSRQKNLLNPTTCFLVMATVGNVGLHVEFVSGLVTEAGVVMLALVLGGVVVKFDDDSAEVLSMRSGSVLTDSMLVSLALSEHHINDVVRLNKYNESLHVTYICNIASG